MRRDLKSLTVWVPPDFVERVRALAERDMTQAATIWRRVIKIGLEAEEAEEARSQTEAAV
jgi:hypothetical protein